MTATGPVAKVAALVLMAYAEGMGMGRLVVLDPDKPVDVAPTEGCGWRNAAGPTGDLAVGVRWGPEPGDLVDPWDPDGCDPNGDEALDLAVLPRQCNAGRVPADQLPFSRFSEICAA